MGAALTVVDATPTGQRLSSFRLELASERITVRELIRRKVLHELAERERGASERRSRRRRSRRGSIHPGRRNR